MSSHVKKSGLLAVALAAAAAWLSTPTAAVATVPGNNGKIAFTSYRDGTGGEIYVANPDGSGQTRITTSGHNIHPAWSPDGTKIAFASLRTGQQDIYVMNADGSGQTRLIATGGNHYPAWSPDGTKIAFTGTNEIYVMNANGSGVTRLTNNSELDWHPAWSPDGSKIAFVSYRDDNQEIYVMNPDGSGQTRLTNHPEIDQNPTWSPDGTRIAFGCFRGPGGQSGICVMNANGSGAAEITGSTKATYEPSWSPDGTKITFSREQQNDNADIFVMSANGSGQVQLTTALGHDRDVDWQAVPLPALSVEDVSVGEAGGSASVTVRLNHPGTVPVTVTAATFLGSATAGSDYQATSENLTFAPGVTSRTLTVPIINDSIDESNETIGIRLTNPGNATIARAIGFVTIIDNDAPPAGLISIDDTVVDGVPPGVMTPVGVVVRLSAPTDHPVTVDYATANNTATAGQDYVATSGTLTIPAGQSSAVITVFVTSDGDAVTTETFFVNLANAVGGKLIDRQGVVSLRDCTTSCDA